MQFWLKPVKLDRIAAKPDFVRRSADGNDYG